MRKIILSILAVAASNCLLAQNRTIEFNHGSFKELMATAKKENKLIFIDCYTTWCGPCKWLAKNVFTNDTAADFYNKNFVNAKIDMEKGEGLEIAARYGIQAYPTALYLDGDGVQVYRFCGAAPVSLFVETGKEALNPALHSAVAANKFNFGKTDAKSAADYFSLLDRGCQDHSKEVENYFANRTDKDLASRANWNILYKYENNYHSKAFEELNNSKEKFAKLYTADSVNSKIEHVLESGMWDAIKAKNKVEFEAIKTQLTKNGSPTSKELITNGDLQMAKQEGNWKAYGKYAEVYVEQFISEKPVALNNLCWSIYENVTDVPLLEKAAAWSKKSTELSPEWANFDTYASLLFKLGRKELAKSAAEKAIEAGKKEGADVKETEELLKRINVLK